MNHHYDDIRSRIDEEPRWWDEYAVPRYCDPAPRRVANIYAREVAFVGIECQSCGERFTVAFSYSPWPHREPLSERIDTLHYGDPPNVGCCAAGATMNSVPIRVLQFWRRGKPKVSDWVWERVPELEVDLTAPWEAGTTP